MEVSNPDSIPVYDYDVVSAFLHSPSAFTQGLVYHNGFLYEGTGLHGNSSLRKVELETGHVIKIHILPATYFGEGVTIYKDRIIQLTYKNNTGFVYIERDTFELIDSFGYPTEGWGITHDGTHLIMSDGTPRLHYFEPHTYRETGHIDVHARGSPVIGLNELEFIQGKIYANIWYSDSIAIIEPQTGEVVGWINLAGLRTLQDLRTEENVPNGIAYDAGNVRLFVAGKQWPVLYEIKVATLNYLPEIVAYSPAPFCSIKVDSTLLLSISAEDPYSEDSLAYVWTIHGVIDTSNCDTVFLYTSSSARVDTVKVRVDDGMFCDSTSWIIFVYQK